MKLEKEINQKKFRSDTHKLGVNIIYTFNWLNALYISLLKPHKITTQQFNVLRIIRGQQPDPASIKTIRERMLDKMSDASRIVEKLRVKGFVERKICTNDRRACDVLLTDKGKKLLVNINAQISDFDSLFSSLNATETKQINFLLDKLRGE